MRLFLATLSQGYSVEAATKTANDVSKLRDVVLLKGVNNFLAEKNTNDEQESNRNLLIFYIGKRRDNDEHEDDTTGTEQSSLEQKGVAQTSDQGGQ